MPLEGDEEQAASKSRYCSADYWNPVSCAGPLASSSKGTRWIAQGERGGTNVGASPVKEKAYGVPYDY